MSEPLIEVLHGPNLNLLALRDPTVYGGLSYGELERQVAAWARELGLRTRFAQTNDAGRFVWELQRIARAARGWGLPQPAGLIVNPGAFTHYAWSIHDALEMAGVPAVEVHLSDPASRDPWRATSVVADLSIATVAGKGLDGYRIALQLLAERLRGGGQR